MTKRLRCLPVLLMWSSLVFAHEGEDGHQHERKPQPVPDAVLYRPLATPDRIVLTWTGDPAVSQAVTWRTDPTVPASFAEIAVADDGPGFAKRLTRVDADDQLLESDLGPALYHTAVFDNLTPKTKYVYRVGDGANWSEWSHFVTASDTPEPFTFVYFGDAQNDVKSMWSRVVREAYRDAPRAAFFLHAGDLINRANRDAEWGEWFYAGGFINRSTPCIATPGNHEYTAVTTRRGKERQLSLNWRPTFAFPLNGPEELPESVYYIDYQGVRIVSLNSNDRHEVQAKWLEGVLEENPHRWTILTFHHPIYSSSEGRDNAELRELWQPIFDRFRVDLVLQGHDHTYARSGLMEYQNVPIGLAEQSATGGTVYVVSVSGPKMYELAERPFMRRSATNTQLYQIIHVNGDELTYEARTATGRLHDAFTLKKQDGKPNELIDRIPETDDR